MNTALPAEEVKAMKSKKPLLPTKEALDQITKFLTAFQPDGVQGFSITAKTKVSSINLKWGCLKIKGRNP